MNRIARFWVVAAVTLWSVVAFHSPSDATTNPRHGTISAPVERSSSTLRRGSTGPAVVELQRALTKAGWPVVADGIFGRATYRTVRMYQRANGLIVDGIVGAQTRRHLGISGGATSTDDPIRNVSRYHHPNPNVDRWWDEALRAGWSIDQWPVVACIMEHPIYTGTAESRGIPTVHNTRYPDDSRGLMQVNLLAHRSWVGPMVNWNFDSLFDGETNLRVAHRLWELAGNSFSPWRSTWERSTCFAMEGSR